LEKPKIEVPEKKGIRGPDPKIEKLVSGEPLPIQV
jgi:hypothetical protein